jgi:hypothetical protein
MGHREGHCNLAACITSSIFWTLACISRVWLVASAGALCAASSAPPHNEAPAQQLTALLACPTADEQGPHARSSDHGIVYWPLQQSAQMSPKERGSQSGSS